MKKFAYLGLVVVLLAFSVVPVLAASPNGHGSGNNPGQNNSSQDQTQPQNKGLGNSRGHNLTNPGKGGNQNPGARVRTPFYLQGTVVSTDTMTMTVTISVTHGNAQVKDFIGKDITVTVTDTTKIVKLTQGDGSEGTESESSESAAPAMSATDDETPGNKVPITFSQLTAGDIVAVHGNVVGGVYEATFITVYVKGTQTGLASILPTGLAELSSKLGFLHGHSFKVGKFVINLP